MRDFFLNPYLLIPYAALTIAAFWRWRRSAGSVSKGSRERGDANVPEYLPVSLTRVELMESESRSPKIGSERVRIQLEVDQERLNDLANAAGAHTVQDLYRNAEALFEWAVRNSVAGRTIAAIDPQSRTYRAVTTPVLEALHPSVAERGDDADAKSSKEPESGRDVIRPAESLADNSVDADESSRRVVMVVDDSKTVRRVTARLLERQGYEVILAKDGIEAIELLQRRRPDVMLLDIEMPRMDGFEVLRRVRQDSRLADLPIVSMYSRTGEERPTDIQLGIRRSLNKPLRDAEVLEAIRAVAGAQKKARRAPRAGYDATIE